MEVSEWVLQRISEVSRLVGVSFDGFEAEARQLFTAIEQKWHTKIIGEKVKEKRVEKKVERELRKLECNVVYERKGVQRGTLGKQR